MIMSKRIILGLLSCLVLTPIASAQGVALPAPRPNLWSFLLPTAEQKANCKTHFCNSGLGKMVSSATVPMSAMTGGLMPNCCLKNSIENDIAKKPPTSSEGAAARIKKDEEEAKARREAVRFLGTVDCNYWPEATEALIQGLRKDPNECVRFEAALSLRNGCCCNEKTVKALEMCVSGSDKDGSPVERSDRVRAAAADALARCPLIQKEIEKEKNGEIKKTEGVDPRDYYRNVAQMPREQVVASARGLLVSLQNVNNPATSASPGAVAPSYQRSGSLSGIVANAFGNTHVAPAPVSVRVPSKPQLPYEVVTTPSAEQESIVPARNVRPAVLAPAWPQYGVPTAAPAAMPSNVQGGFQSPLPTGPQSSAQPSESTGYVTVPGAPVNLRLSRP